MPGTAQAQPLARMRELQPTLRPWGTRGQSVEGAQAAALSVAVGWGVDRVEHVAMGPGQAQEHIWSSPRGRCRLGPEDDNGGQMAA